MAAARFVVPWRRSPAGGDAAYQVTLTRLPQKRRCRRIGDLAALYAIIPITVAGTSTRSVLGVAAGSATASPELDTSNNIAKRSLRVGSLPAGVTTRAKGKTIKR